MNKPRSWGYTIGLGVWNLIGGLILIAIGALLVQYCG
jgi:hypothetical protein